MRDPYIWYISAQATKWIQMMEDDDSSLKIKIYNRLFDFGYMIVG